MKICGIKGIDKINKELVKEAKLAILSKERQKLLLMLSKIQEFRHQLAYDRSTEMLESNFGWANDYDKIISKIESLL
jgi:hypothetical protein